MNLNSVKVPKMSGGGATSSLIKFGVIVGLSVYGVSNSLYSVEGGHRAIVFNRIGGVKNKKKPVADQAGKLKPSLSKDVLARVFGGQCQGCTSANIS